MHCSPPLQVVVARSPMADSCAVEPWLRLAAVQHQANRLACLSALPACSGVDQGLHSTYQLGDHQRLD